MVIIMGDDVRLVHTRGTSCFTLGAEQAADSCIIAWKAALKSSSEKARRPG